MNTLKYNWDESSKKVPENKTPSNYAIEKELLFPRNSLICDIGGGIGIDSLYFISKGHSACDLDVSDYALEVAQRKSSKLKLTTFTTVQSDLSNGSLPFENNSFDIVFSHLSLHYFSLEITSRLLKEISRILKPSGKAFISMKSPDDKEEMSHLKSNAKEIEPSVFDDNGQTKTRFSKETYNKMLKDNEIRDYSICDYLEDFSNRKDKVQSGLNQLAQIEIVINN